MDGVWPPCRRKRPHALGGQRPLAAYRSGMHTIDASTLGGGGEPAELRVIEIDSEYGHMQTCGRAEVAYERGDLISLETGGCYDYPSVIGQTQLWNAEEHYLAAFPDEASMKAGIKDLLAGFGDELRVGLHREMTAALAA